jgi:hypothetical protein
MDPLVPAERHCHLAAATSAALPPDEPASRMLRVVRVANGPGRTGMAAGRETQVLTGGLPGDHPAGIEHARNHRGVDLGNIALKHAGTIHHRHAGNADVVLDGNALAGQHATLGAGDVHLPIPGIVGVFLGRRPIARVTRVFDRQLRLSELVEPRIGRDRSRHKGAKRGGVGLGQGHAKCFR